MTPGSATPTVVPASGGGGRRRVRWSGLVTVLLAAMVLFLALLALPGILGYGTLVVRSGSMQQTAPVGSLVVARPLEVDDVRVGDVILIRREGTAALAPVLHRVVTLRHREGDVVVTTKGDSNRTPDATPYILRGTTMTPVIAVPYVGRAFALIRTPVGWTLLIAIPATMLLCARIRTIWFPPRRPGAHRSPASRFHPRRLAVNRSRATWLPPRRDGSPNPIPIPNDHVSAAT